METRVEIIIQRLNALKKIRQPYEKLWKKVTDYVLPRRSFWDVDVTPGKEPDQKIFDGSGLSALQLMADGMLGYLLSPHLRWFRLAMEDRRQQDIPWVPDWLEEIEDILYAEFARSNLYDSAGEYVLDAGSIGTAVMLEDEDKASGRILFSARHMKECYIAEDRFNMVDTLFREFYMTNRQAMQIWSKSLSAQRQDVFKNNPYGKAQIIHAVFPRGEREPGKIDGLNKAWTSIYIDAEYHDNKVIDEGGYDEFPYHVWRWRKNSDELYGRSPAMDAIQDILRIQQISKTQMEAAQLAVQPPLNVPTSMKGQERIIPRGYNYYQNKDELIFPINLGQNYPITEEMEQKVKDQINDVFRTKIFLLMEQLEGGPYTATEIRERQGEKAAVLGAIIGRMNSEFLIPLIRRTVALCMRRGLLPPPPPELARGGRIKIEFQGPLAQAQRRFHQSQGVTSSLQLLGAMQQMFPESLDNVDADELVRAGMDSQGVPQKTIREKPEVTEIRRMRQEAREKEKQEAVALEQQKLLAGNAEKLNQPLKPDSMLAGIGQAAKEKTSGR